MSRKPKKMPAKTIFDPLNKRTEDSTCAFTNNFYKQVVTVVTGFKECTYNVILMRSAACLHNVFSSNKLDT